MRQQAIADGTDRDLFPFGYAPPQEPGFADTACLAREPACHGFRRKAAMSRPQPRLVESSCRIRMMHFMREVDLKQIDLNLLVALEALLREQSVTRAADRVGRSQPAMSRALSRLRQTFGDPLMVVSGRSLVPTPRAIELRERLAPVLESIRGLIEEPDFDPATANTSFRISAPEGTVFLILGKLLAQAAVEAPRMNFTIMSAAERQVDALQSGDIDLVVDTFVDAPNTLRRQSLIEDHLVCVVRRDHPATRQPFDIDAFVRWPHIRVESATSRALDLRLERLGVERRCSIRVTSFFAGATVTANTDHIMVLPDLVASAAFDRSPLTALAMPFEMQRLSLDQLWHPRRQHDPAHIWLRNRILETTQAIARQLRSPSD